MMTKKDYIRAAEIVRNVRVMAYEFDSDADDVDPSAFVEDAFVTFFTHDNPRFDETRFREACKVKP